jgi:hypothetical protein
MENMSNPAASHAQRQAGNDALLISLLSIAERNQKKKMLSPNCGLLAFACCSSSGISRHCWRFLIVLIFN